MAIELEPFTKEQIKDMEFELYLSNDYDWRDFKLMLRFKGLITVEQVVNYGEQLIQDFKQVDMVFLPAEQEHEIRELIADFRKVLNG